MRQPARRSSQGNPGQGLFGHFGRLLQSLSVEVFEAGGLCFEAEVGFSAAAAGGGETAGESGVSEKTGDCLGESALVAGETSRAVRFPRRLRIRRVRETPAIGKPNGLGLAQSDGQPFGCRRWQQ